MSEILGNINNQEVIGESSETGVTKTVEKTRELVGGFNMFSLELELDNWTKMVRNNNGITPSL